MILVKYRLSLIIHMQRVTLVACLALAILSIAISVNNNSNHIFYVEGQAMEEQSTFSKEQDSVSVLLDGKIIPFKGFHSLV